jgi:methyl-accepting chemotaxis protein
MNPQKKNTPHFKRKQVYINKDFQTRFIIKFVLVLVLGGVISIGLTLFNTQNTLTSSFVNSKLVIQDTSLAIMPSVIYTNIITTTVACLIMAFVAMLVSHKIAGPMFRFEKDIKRITSGDLKNRINVRKGDQFQALAISLNNMIDHLNAELTDINNQAAALSEKKDLPESCRKDILRLNEKINSSFIL